MSAEAQIALIGAIASVLVACIPLLVQLARAKGIAISRDTEEFIRDSVMEGAQLAEEIARKENGAMSGQEKLILASKHAQNLLAKHKINIAETDLYARVEANLSSVVRRDK